MSYTKIDPPADMANAVALALAQNSVDAGIAQALLDAGAAVELETGDQVWLSCVVDDKPDTPQIDLLTVAIALTGGDPWTKDNGQIVARVFWHGLWAEELASLTLSVARKALMMSALGEPQPQVPIPAPVEGGPTEQDAIPFAGTAGNYSIRSAISATRDIDAPLTDVL